MLAKVFRSFYKDESDEIHQILFTTYQVWVSRDELPSRF